jgi:hypothetical protein
MQEQVGHHRVNVVKERIERGIPEPEGAQRWFDEGPRYFEPVESVGSRHRHGTTFELPLLRCSTFGSAKVWPHRRSHKMERQEIKKI